MGVSAVNGNARMVAIGALALLGITAIVGIVIGVSRGNPPDSALVALAASAVGGIAGVLVPVGLETRGQNGNTRR